MKAEMRKGTPVLRVVLDTNVWISAALTPAGIPAELVQRVLASIQPVFSSATFAELETRLWRPKFDRNISMEIRKRVLHDLHAAALWVEVPTTAQTYCRDPEDDRCIHTAFAAEAPWLVTGDQDLLLVPIIPNLHILTPADALRLMATRH